MKLAAYKALNGHFPINFKFIWYKGVRISQDDFKRIKESLK